jgi:hypothetical protein
MQAVDTDAKRKPAYPFWRQARDVAILFVAALVTWQVVARVVRRTFTPPGNAKSIAAMSQTGEPVTHLAKLLIDGHVHYVWLGRTVWLAAPSGPACYVFNAQGALIASTPTTGDRELHQYCDAAWKQPLVALPRVLAEIRRGESAR